MKTVLLQCQGKLDQMVEQKVDVKSKVFVECLKKK